MVAAASLIGVVFGAMLSRAARWFPERTEAMEFVAGAVLLLGFGLLGSTLPVVL